MRARPTSRMALPAIIVSLSVLLLSGCLDPGDKSTVAPQVEPAPVFSPSSPENLIKTLQVIYNDQVRDAAERYLLYQDLFPPADHATLPGFIFHLQPVDLEPGEETSWGLDTELQAHENMFRAQANKEIFALELSIQHAAPIELEYPSQDQQDWREIFATNVSLQLKFNPQDGLWVDGAQAKFVLAPADDRWYIVDWTDLPRPFVSGGNSAVEPASWGSVKAHYRDHLR